MASETALVQSPAPGVSRYTQAMAKCLDQVASKPGGAPDRAAVQTLVNLVQGRMLEYLADRICRDYEIRDEQSKYQIVTALLGIFSDEFFALFRSKIDFKPQLALMIARRIIRKECGPHTKAAPNRQPSDRLYPALFRKYFEYRNLGEIQAMVETDVEIQKIILLAQLKPHFREAPGLRKLADILERDHEGSSTSFFMDLVKRGEIARVMRLVESGAWEGEVQALHQHLAHLRGD